MSTEHECLPVYIYTYLPTCLLAYLPTYATRFVCAVESPYPSRRSVRFFPHFPCRSFVRERPAIARRSVAYLSWWTDGFCWFTFSYTCFLVLLLPTRLTCVHFEFINFFFFLLFYHPSHEYLFIYFVFVFFFCYGRVRSCCRCCGFLWNYHRNVFPQL